MGGGPHYCIATWSLDGRQTSTPAYLAAHDITGLPPDATFYQFSSDTREYEFAGFGDLTYHFNEQFSLSGGLRDGRYGTTVDSAAGFNSQYFVYALYGLSACLRAPTPASAAHYPSAGKTSWKASLTYEPSHDLTLYTTVSTGYRTPVYNALAGSVSTVNPKDLVIPTGATSDNLINYELGLKGRWLDGRLTSNLAGHIDWRNLQIQANRLSDLCVRCSLRPMSARPQRRFGGRDHLHAGERTGAGAERCVERSQGDRTHRAGGANLRGRGGRTSRLTASAGIALRNLHSSVWARTSKDS